MGIASLNYLIAEPLCKKALEIVERALGSVHPKVATSLNNLMELYKKVGKEEEAKRLEERAKKSVEKTGKS